ncbi:ubiquitin carboxyl-terminal hydrolase 18 [Humulus lupulus]|uniref:ubiquitin carboxyl-terminal hydrolase 18 n=1 Tax=Humulus lupulus TaxID=3486 RepID=UPI002B417368|nr:ubiquitin carboxyl-terminal hydrolase 18 [Humulus lupulus]
MHVAGVSLDLNWFLQVIFTVFLIAVGLLHLVKNTASKYFEVGANFEGGDTTDRSPMPGVLLEDLACVVCGNSGPKKCSRCKAVRYCSQKCQEVHWKDGHKKDCKIVQSTNVNSTQKALRDSQSKTSGAGGKTFSGIALVPTSGSGTPKPIKQPKEILFPYGEFVDLFNWNKPGFLPCGLLNCGNSCFANAVLQCLASTRPLVAYLLEKGHRTECIRSDWCFLCEFQTHIERVSQSTQPFSPTNIISRLPNIGGNLGYGRQEDAHEFMRFAIDTMQSVCLDEFGGEKAVPPSSQETTIIQHIFGGLLQSQVICTKCDNVSNQYENMMDLTVEIHGEAASLEECLDQFTVKEWLHGDNMYKCDKCNDYVKASKRLTVKRAPNILTIALKRFQSGRFGKLNKRVTFPETLDLSPYMSDAEDGMDVYKLYAVVVHVDMLNASFFGHYICYTKDLGGNWYRLDDCKVARVELEEVLAQGAYMLLYSRVKARPSCLRAPDPPKEVQQQTVDIEVEVEDSPKKQLECFSHGESADPVCSSVSVLEEQQIDDVEVELSPMEQTECSPRGDSAYPIPSSESVLSDSNCCAEMDKKESRIRIDSESVTDVAILEASPVANEESSCSERELCCRGTNSPAFRQGQKDQFLNNYQAAPSCCNGSVYGNSGIANDLDATNHHPYPADKEEDIDMVGCDLSSFHVAKDIEIYSNGHADPDKSANKIDSGFTSSSVAVAAAAEVGTHNLKKRGFHGNGIKSVEIMGDS